MTHYWFCRICERVAVERSGDTCLRCASAIEALIYPNDRILTYRPRPPLGVRILHRITGRATT